MYWDNHNSGTWDLPELAKLDDLPSFLKDIRKDPERYNDSNAVMPIVPIFDEKHRAIIIVLETETEYVNIATKLKLAKTKDYKSQNVRQTQVITAKQFFEAWEKK